VKEVGLSRRQTGYLSLTQTKPRLLCMKWIENDHDTGIDAQIGLVYIDIETY
jgi:hypothetical protein